MEGETYKPEIDGHPSNTHIDIETIPTKPSCDRINVYVVFYLETTGSSRNSDVTQISAFDGESMLNLYVSPRQPISPKASDVSGITFSF